MLSSCRTKGNFSDVGGPPSPASARDKARGRPAPPSGRPSPAYERTGSEKHKKKNNDGKYWKNAAAQERETLRGGNKHKLVNDWGPYRIALTGQPLNRNI